MLQGPVQVLLSSKVSTLLQKDEISILQAPLCHKGVGVLCVSLRPVLSLTNLWTKNMIYKNWILIGVFYTIYISTNIFLTINICPETSAKRSVSNILKVCLSHIQQDSCRGARDGDPRVGRFGYKGHLSLIWTDSHRAMWILHNWILSQQVPFDVRTLKRMQ